MVASEADGACGFGRWADDGHGLPEFRVEVGTCPPDAWHLVGSPGLLSLAHVGGAISLYSTAGGMWRLVNRSAVVTIDGAEVGPVEVVLGADRCTWVFERGGVRVTRTIAGDPDRARLELRWTIAAQHPTVVTERWSVDALPLLAAPLMSRRVAPPSTHHGSDRWVWGAMFTGSDAARRLTDEVRRLVGRRHPLRGHVDPSGRRIRWSSNGSRRLPKRPRWFLATPPALELTVEPSTSGADASVHGDQVRLSVDADGAVTFTATLELDDPLLDAALPEPADLAPIGAAAVVPDGSDVLVREADWHVHQLRALRVPDPYVGRRFVMQGSAYGFVHGLHGAVRDEAIVVVALTPFDPATARETLLSTASMARPDGTFHYAHTGCGAVASGGVHASPTDLPLFFLWAASRYVEIAGDRDVLHEAVPRRGRARGSATTSVAEVASAAVRALDAHVGTGPHGMLRVGSGDWADPISLMVRRRRAFHRHGESTFNTAMALAVLPGAAELLDGWDRAAADRCRSLVAELDVALESAWTGRWYLRGWDGRGGPIGAERCFLDAQVWAVIAGHGPPVRCAALVEVMGRLLDDPSPIGPTILDRPHRVRLGMLADGWDCNGGVWAALGGLAVEAFALHDPQRAAASLHRQSFEHRRHVYPDIWFGQWSAPDATNSWMGDQPGGTYVHPATPMTEFPVMNSNAHAGPLLGLVAVDGDRAIHR